MVTAPAIVRNVPAPHQRDEAIRARLAGPDPGPMGERLVLLHFRGRRTGRDLEVVAGLHRIGGALHLATGSRWRHNFAGGTTAALTWRGRRRPAELRLVESLDATVAGYARLISEYGRTDAERRLGIIINVDRTPTGEEVRDAVRRCGLSLVEVRLEEEQR
ncbi:hypothetical protein BJY16_006791 [Actinoplanes octamycinicus]|uniref:Uncharacterized protein n=1 Tax=Actinoplanes octamycinicus TaxID=135948 RepID=A0A7W7H452_9ACTN|nr:hypothetical protein [Actinoplanes octamycinicus]MBB4743332.1 hypothetical protein [Actinoplanes octamycinicus]GIE61848.1 hypothetical protein Aoc01nite_72500 [Actinoplanes octamycinicus]